MQRYSRTALSNHNAKIPFEDDSVHGLLVDNIDLTKTIERAPMEIRSDRGMNLNLSNVLTPVQVEKLSNKDQWHEAEVLGQVPGAMVIVNTPIIGFNVGKLVKTQDDYESWTIQWFNIKDAGVEGKSRLTNTYLPCWIDKTSGEEVRSVLQPENSDPMLCTVKRKRILFEPFELTSSGKLPKEVQAKLKSKYASEKLVF